MTPRNSHSDTTVKDRAGRMLVQSVGGLRTNSLPIAGRIMGAVMLVLLPACGVNVTQSYPNRLVGAEGQRFTVEDLRAIARDSELDTEGKREAFRDLGILDEKLIDALLNL